uniref:Uncharacterized protein n=1 Tax=Caenorhabditis japonica TaxID=281687 RepID=A0A8R1IUZ7_CAEJA
MSAVQKLKIREAHDMDWKERQYHNHIEQILADIDRLEVLTNTLENLGPKRVERGFVAGQPFENVYWCFTKSSSVLSRGQNVLDTIIELVKHRYTKYRPFNKDR